MSVNKHNKISMLCNSEASELKRSELPSYTTELGSFPDRLLLAVGDRSVRSFATECGMSDTVVRQYLSGKSEPTRLAIIAIARVAGCSIEWLLTGEGPMKRGKIVEAGAEEPKEDTDTKRADRSPVKQAAVSYIDAMTDMEATKVISFIVSLQDVNNDQLKFTADGRRITDDIRRLMNMSPEGKKELRAILEARIKSLEDESASDLIELRPTGT